MDSTTLNRMLLDRFQEVCAMLLPNGRVEGNLYVVGGLDGQKGDSLKITLSGGSAGRFKDFADPDHGKGATPLYLWSKTQGIPFSEACRRAREWLGVKDDDYGIRKHRAREFAKLDRTEVRPLEPNTPIMDYLIGERKLDPIVVAKAKIGETEDGKAIVFPYAEINPEDGKWYVVHRQYVNLERIEGKKVIRATKGTKRILFGKNLIDDNVSEITITEGQLDCLSFHSWAIPAVSIPAGVSDFDWVDLDWEWLERFERINVCMDMDDPGKLAAPDICKRLGLHRCYIVSLPHKDVNECLQEGVTREEMLKCLKDAKPIELDEIKKPNEYIEEVLDYYTVDWSQRGWHTPWYPALPWRIRKGEFTVLSGFSGSGKTISLNHLLLHLIQQGCKVMDASLEVKPGLTLYNMTRCALAKKNGSQAEVRAAVEWISESMFFLDCIGTVNTDRLLHAMEYARKRHGIDIFVIDSLFKCGLDPADFGAQRTFADKLTTFCNNTNAHVILVAHSRKTQNGNELSIPSKSDVAGSSDITNAAFNVVVWWRNKLKKQKLDEARACFPPNEEVIAEWHDAPDGKAVLDKQRFGEGEEACVPIWLNHESYQFHTVRYKSIPYFQL